MSKPPFLPRALSMAVFLATVGGALAFVRLSLSAAQPFAAVALSLLVAGGIGPFLFTRGTRWWANGALRCAGVAAGATIICLSAGAPVAAGLFCGLYALAAGAVGFLLWFPIARVLVAALAMLLLGTLLYWDDLPLRAGTFGGAKESAARAFRLSAVAAVSVSMDFDWLHARSLYTNNFTAEAMAGVERKGMGSFSLKLLAISGAALALAAMRERRQ